MNLAGEKELLGLWITQNESSKFWLSVLTELQNRGVKDIFIACVDGLTGFPEAIETVYLQTQIQLCIVHLVRNSLSYVSYKDRKAVAADLKLVYGAATDGQAEHALMTKAIYTTNAIESMCPAGGAENMTLRKILRNHRSFPTDESAMKVINLAIQNISKKWTRPLSYGEGMPIRDWKSALNRFAIEFEWGFPCSHFPLDTNYFTNPEKASIKLIFQLMKTAKQHKLNYSFIKFL